MLTPYSCRNYNKTQKLVAAILSLFLAKLSQNGKKSQFL